MIFVRCTGNGSPTVILEGGDEDAGASYDFAVPSLAKITRTCSYDRANLGLSDPAPGPRGLTELVADLEHAITGAKIPGPYVLVGTSGGGYITAGYAFAHPQEVTGMVFVDVGAPFRDPPAQLVRDTAWDSPSNIEKRDYLQVEKDAWSARERVGDIPVTVISNEYTPEQIASAEFPSERRGMRTNVKDQKGWLLLSPQAKQEIVHTGHAVEEANPTLVTNAIRDVVQAARAAANAG
jgi:pimeloyl-ACP methyl ester carboxylesterase